MTRSSILSQYLLCQKQSTVLILFIILPVSLIFLTTSFLYKEGIYLKVIIPIYFLIVFQLFFLRQTLTMKLILAWNSLYIPGWPPSQGPPASASWALGLQACTPTLGKLSTFKRRRSSTLCCFVERVDYFKQ
jgi:hypothetical protein